MPLLVYNVLWMSWNLFLAFLGLLFAWLFVHRSSSRFFEVVYALLWLLFVPNTIYILTDIKHFPVQWFEAFGWQKMVLTFQYQVFLVLGIFSFFYSLQMVEEGLIKKSKKNRFIKKIPIRIAFIVLNFLIAFGVILGRTQRTNSWEFFTNFPRVLQDCIVVFTSLELMTWVALFGLLANAIYFSYRKYLV